MAKLSKLEKSLLETVKAGTASIGYAFVDANDAESLVASGHIEVNSEVKDEAGNVAARIPGGILAQAVVSEVVEPVSSGYAIEAGIPMPAAKKRQGGKKGEVYPFSKLEVGASFFVAASEKKQDPAKSLRGTISTAVRRFATVSDTVTRTNRKGETVPALVATKRFVVEPVTAGQTYSNGFVEKADGARVFRTA